jgi:hypothetical protein
MPNRDRLTQDHEARLLKLSDKALGYDLGRDFSCLISARLEPLVSAIDRQISTSRALAGVSVLWVGVDLSFMASEDTWAREHFKNELP